MSEETIAVSAESTTPVSDDWATWPFRALPRVIGTRTPNFQIVVRQSALNDIIRHGKSAPDIEVCGVVLGNVYRDEYGPLLFIEAVIRGDRAEGHAAQVTFTSETWSYIHEQLERTYADKKIAGWYHTHPGHGIFLSGMDLFIQENFFNLPWQVAYVYDPQRGEDGMFCWRHGETVRDEYLIEPDEVELFSRKALTKEQLRGEPPKPKKAESGENYWAPVLVLVVSFAIGVFLMGWLDAPVAPVSALPSSQPSFPEPGAMDAGVMQSPAQSIVLPEGDSISAAAFGTTHSGQTNSGQTANGQSAGSIPAGKTSSGPTQSGNVPASQTPSAVLRNASTSPKTTGTTNGLSTTAPNLTKAATSPAGSSLPKAAPKSSATGATRPGATSPGAMSPGAGKSAPADPYSLPPDAFHTPDGGSASE